MPAQPTVLAAAQDLHADIGYELFRGAEHGVDVSFFINHTPPGHGPRRHRHPYPEVFVVHTGEATFTVDAESIVAGGGHVIVVPAGATHGFRNTGPDVLEMTSIHPVARMRSEWIEES